MVVNVRPKDEVGAAAGVDLGHLGFAAGSPVPVGAG